MRDEMCVCEIVGGVGAQAGRWTRGRTRFDTFAKHITATSIIVTIIGFVTSGTGISHDWRWQLCQDLNIFKMTFDMFDRTRLSIRRNKKSRRAGQIYVNRHHQRLCFGDKKLFVHRNRMRTLLTLTASLFSTSPAPERGSDWGPMGLRLTSQVSHLELVRVSGPGVGFGWIGLGAGGHQSRALGRLRLVVEWCAAAAGETVWRPLPPASTDWWGRLTREGGRPSGSSSSDGLERVHAATATKTNTNYATATTIIETNTNCAINILPIIPIALPVATNESFSLLHNNQPSNHWRESLLAILPRGCVLNHPHCIVSGHIGSR